MNSWDRSPYRMLRSGGFSPTPAPTPKLKSTHTPTPKSVPGNVHATKLGYLIHLLLTAIISLFFTFSFTYGQTAYSGGAGDGYGRTEFNFIMGDPGAFVPSLVYPTVVGQGESFTVRVEGVRNKLEIIVRSLTGAFLHRNVAWGIDGTFEQKIGIDGWAAGMYLVDVRVDGRTYRHKLIVMRVE